MAKYGVPLATVTERDAPGGGTMLTGRLGDAVIIGLPMESCVEGAARRWKLTVVEPTRTGMGNMPSHARGAERDKLAARAERRKPLTEPR